MSVSWVVRHVVGTEYRGWIKLSGLSESAKTTNLVMVLPGEAGITSIDKSSQFVHSLLTPASRWGVDAMWNVSFVKDLKMQALDHQS